MQITESTLLDRAAAGDNAALAALLQKYEPQLLEYARRRLPKTVYSLAAPEDIVQQTCYEACRMISDFVPQGASSFKRWLIRIANLRIRASIQSFRSRKTYAVSNSINDDDSTLGAIEQLVIYRRTPSASAAVHEFVATVERALERLHVDYRLVIQHRFIEGLSVQETAERMSRDSDKVYVLCSRALAALRLQIASVSHFR